MNTPVRLHKKENHDTSLFDKFEAWLQSHATFFIIVCMILMFILLIVLIYAIMGVSAAGTESNVYYYHLEDII